jgi:hypothetical protein
VENVPCKRSEEKEGRIMNRPEKVIKELGRWGGERKQY